MLSWNTAVFRQVLYEQNHKTQMILINSHLLTVTSIELNACYTAVCRQCMRYILRISSSRTNTVLEPDQFQTGDTETLCSNL